MPFDKSYDLIGYDEAGKEVVSRRTVAAARWYGVGDDIEQSGTHWQIVRVRNTTTEGLRLVVVRRVPNDSEPEKEVARTA
jgi:hypothetical protein